MNKDNFGDNIHGNIFEALVGAIFLDSGYKAVKDLFMTVLLILI